MLAPRFGVSELVETTSALLADDPLPLEVDAESAARVRSHVATVWASFTSQVRKLLQLRYETAAALGQAPIGEMAATEGGYGPRAGAGSWSSSLAWRLLGELYTSARARDDFVWIIDPVTKELEAAGGERSDGRDAIGRVVPRATGTVVRPALSSSAAPTGISINPAPPAVSAQPSTPTSSTTRSDSVSWAEDLERTLSQQPDSPGLRVPFLYKSPPVEGSELALPAVERYVAKMRELLVLERDEALSAAEDDVLAAEAEEDEGGGRAVEAEARPDRRSGAAVGTESARYLTKLAMGAEDAASEGSGKLRDVLLRNVQTVSGRLGSRCILTIAADPIAAAAVRACDWRPHRRHAVLACLLRVPRIPRVPLPPDGTSRCCGTDPSRPSTPRPSPMTPPTVPPAPSH